MLYHSIQKGLALPGSRPGFAKEKVRALLVELQQYTAGGAGHALVGSAVATLDQYLERMLPDDPDREEIQEAVERVRCRIPSEDCSWSKGGTIQFGGLDNGFEEWAGFDDFARRRHSVRQFQAKKVSPEVIERAVEVAQTAPSVCNRQSGRVHICLNADRISRVLACQQGNLGFGHQVPAVLVVTSDLCTFLSIGERNQCWIDGGLFAMNLIYALQAQGIATCCLNWSVDMEADARLREVANIPPSESIIFLVAAGYPPVDFPVARSKRRPLEEVLRYVS